MKMQESETLELKTSTADFKEVAEMFITTFKRKIPTVTPQIILTKLEASILKIVQKNPVSSREEIAKVLAISPETVKEYLAKLKEKGVLKRVGPDKGGYWEVT